MALAEALARFQQARSGLIADAIHVLGAAVEFTPPVERKNFAFHHAWLKACADPAARTWCLKQLLSQLPKLSEGKEQSYGDKANALIERVQALLALDPDPRIGRAMVDNFILDAPVIGFSEVADVMARALVLHADDSLAARIKEAAPPMLASRRLRLPTKVTLPAEETARWQALLPTPPASVDALWAAVHASPEDDRPLSVLADALQERGDPRGELIALQLREARGEPTDHGRIRELIKEHGKTWLGELRPVLVRGEFQRGLLTTFELGGKWNAPAKTWPKLARSPLLSAVTHFELGKASDEIVALFVSSPAMRSLRAVTLTSDVALEALQASPPPRLDSVACFGWKRHDPLTRFRERILPWVLERPAITGLGCQAEWLPHVPPALAERLRHLRVGGDLEDLAALAAAWPKLESLTVEGLHRLELQREKRATVLRIWPSGFFANSAFKGTLPAEVQRVEIHGNAAWAKRSRGAFGRAEVIEHPLPSGLVTGVK